MTWNSVGEYSIFIEVITFFYWSDQFIVHLCEFWASLLFWLFTEQIIEDISLGVEKHYIAHHPVLQVLNGVGILPSLNEFEFVFPLTPTMRAFVRNLYKSCLAI